MVVVLPAPFGPKNPKISPTLTFKLTPSIPRLLPYSFVTFFMLIAVFGITVIVADGHILFVFEFMDAVVIQAEIVRNLVPHRVVNLLL